MQDRAIRRAQEEKIIKKRLKLVKAVGGKTKDITGKTWYDNVVETPHTLASKHPLDCGKADCLMCHGPKIHKKWAGKKKILKKLELEDE